VLPDGSERPLILALHRLAILFRRHKLQQQFRLANFRARRIQRISRRLNLEQPGIPFERRRDHDCGAIGIEPLRVVAQEPRRIAIHLHPLLTRSRDMNIRIADHRNMKPKLLG
jgi:hypothetical protein